MDDITLTELIDRLQEIAEELDARADGPNPDDLIVRISTGSGWPMQHRLGEAALLSPDTDHDEPIDPDTEGPILYLEVGDHPTNPYTPSLDGAERF